MIPTEQVISELLLQKLIGSKPKQQTIWPIFSGRLPTTPDGCISVHRDSMPTEGRHHRGGETIHHDGFQIHVRHTQYETAQNKILEISDSFDRIVRFVLTVGTKRYRIQSITQLTTPIFIGPDPNNRVNFTLNSLASIREI